MMNAVPNFRRKCSLLQLLAGEGGDVEGAFGFGFEGAGFVFEVNGAFEFVGKDLLGGQLAEERGEAEILQVKLDGLGGGTEAGDSGFLVGKTLAYVVAIEVKLVGAAVYGYGRRAAV